MRAVRAAGAVVERGGGVVVLVRVGCLWRERHGVGVGLAWRAGSTRALGDLFDTVSTGSTGRGMRVLTV